MPESLSGQTRTPPHLKWLLNERAMLAGELQWRQSVVKALLTEIGDLRTRIEALDSAMALFDDRVDPAAAGTVRATKERYGSRGGLRRFLLEDLQQAGTGGRDTATLTIRAAAKFQVPIHTTEDRRRYMDAILWTLRDLRSKGEVEKAYVSKGGRSSSIWCLARTTSLDDLRKQATLP